MGSLTLPTHGTVYLDANGFIYSVERVEPYCTLLEPMWRQARAGEFDVASSDITVLETLVKPLREGDEVVEMLLRSMFDAHEVSLIPATRELWEDAARIRADTGLKTLGQAGSRLRKGASTQFGQMRAEVRRCRTKAEFNKLFCEGN